MQKGKNLRIGMRPYGLRKQIKLTHLDLSEALPDVKKILQSGQIAQGEYVRELETRVGHFLSSPFVVAVNNGTSALELALKVLNLKPGDEVITTPFTFAATLNAILSSGATARFVDIDDKDFNISPEKVKTAISSKTKAILPVHLYGQAASMDELVQISNEANILMIEDSSQSFGAQYKKKYLGTFGIGTFSLYATKNLSAGEGGLITLADESMAERLRILRNQGMRKKYDFVEIGGNYRMTEISAAIALSQLSAYERVIKKRNENAKLLTKELEHLKSLRLPITFTERTHVWHQYTVLLAANPKLSRNELQQELFKLGIETGAYYPKILPDYEVFANSQRVRMEDMTISKNVASQCLSIPIHQGLSDSDIRYVAKSIHRVLIRYGL